MKVGAGVSTELDPYDGAAEAARIAQRSLAGADADLAVVFASGAHLAAPETMLAAIHAELAPGALIGCGAGGVLGAGREVESGTPWPVWAAALDGGSARPFHATVAGEHDTGVLEGLPELGSGAALILLSDPYSFPTDAVLDGLAREAPGCRFSAGSRAPARRWVSVRCSRATRCTPTARSACAWTASRCCRASRRARPRSVAR